MAAKKKPVRVRVPGPDRFLNLAPDFHGATGTVTADRRLLVLDRPVYGRTEWPIGGRDDVFEFEELEVIS